MAKANGKAAVTDMPPAVQEILGQPAGAAPSEVVSVVERPGVKVDTALVEIPLGPIESRFPSPRIDLRLSGDAINQMHRIFTGLKAERKRLANDMPIRSNGDAIRWLLEQVGAMG